MSSTITVPDKKIVRPRLEKPELLAPAGNLEKLKCAVHYGADAVYIGGQQYGLRANADNFSFEEMEEGVRFAHERGAKVFVATNIIAHNEDLPGVHDYYRTLQDIGIDAVIVADPALIQACREAAPDLEVHLSTQTSTANWQAVKFWKEEGVSRIVLAREVSLEEIRQIKEHVDVELEVFIHGAMCISYSGRCVLSNHFTARDSNRGGCCQSCRWKYDLFEEGPDEDALQANVGKREIPLFNEQDDPFTMSSKDLSMIRHIPDIVDLGVESFKIEGRMKSIHYVATVVKVYRQAIDAYCEDPDNYELKPEWIEELKKSGHRSATSGFFYGKPGHEDQLFHEAEEHAQYEFAGLVVDYDEQTGIATVQQRNHFKPGQEVEFFGPDYTFVQTIDTIWDEDGNELDAARHPLQLVRMKVDRPVRPRDMMRKESV
ncbi:MAG: U32 family peptidase [Bacillaceae bacterium]|nr:U32 family peptidase [Bacillaceae bacterium]